MRGCGACTVQTLRRYKGDDEELIEFFTQALDDVRKFADDHLTIGIETSEKTPQLM
jgi:hypothetical protein